MVDEFSGAEMQLDGEVLNGRLVVYADSLGLGLKNLAEALDKIDPAVLLATGKTQASIVADIAAQLLEAAIEYGETEDAKRARQERKRILADIDAADEDD